MAAWRCLQAVHVADGRRAYRRLLAVRYGPRLPEGVKSAIIRHALPCSLPGQRRASVVKLVDAPDSKSGSARSVGSIPTRGTIIKKPRLKVAVFYLAVRHQNPAWYISCALSDRCFQGLIAPIELQLSPASTLPALSVPMLQVRPRLRLQV